MCPTDSKLLENNDRIFGEDFLWVNGTNPSDVTLKKENFKLEYDRKDQNSLLDRDLDQEKDEGRCVRHFLKWCNKERCT